MKRTKGWFLIHGILILLLITGFGCQQMNDSQSIPIRVSDGIRVVDAKRNKVDIWGTYEGDTFRFSRDQEVTLTLKMEEGWIFDETYMNFFSSDRDHVTISRTEDAITLSYCAKVGQTISAKDIEEISIYGVAESLPTLNIAVDGDFSSINRDEWVPATFELRLGSKKFKSGDYSGTGYVKGRGNLSWGTDAKPYSIKLDTKTSLLDIPITKKYAIVSCGLDGSLMRNYITYKTGLRLTGVDYTPKCEFIAVYLNGQYNGIYLLVERVEVETTKVNIQEANENNIDGGYLLEKNTRDKADLERDNWFPAAYRANGRRDIFTIKAPEIVTDEMMDYIEEHMNKLHDAIMGISGERYEKYIDVDSWVDFLIVQELSKNIDGNLKTSCYMVKDPESNTVRMTALWDFDLAYGECDWDNGCEHNLEWDCPTGDTVEDYMIINSSCPWYQKLYEYPEFALQVKETYTKYRKNLIPDIFKIIDEQEAYLANAVKADNLWMDSQKHADAVSKLRTWLTGRIAWLDNQWLIQ